MKKGFPGYFANNSDDLDKLWDECLFVLDANVLLSLYRYSDSTRSELLSTFNSLSNRLWIPHQVAHEYLSNRLNVIGEQIKTYDDSIKKTDALKKSLENANQHPFVKTETLLTCNETFALLTNELTENRLTHEKRISSDEIKDYLETLLENSVGEEYTRDQIETALIEGKARYDEKIPPGYCDVKKGGDSPLFADRCKPYGDYIVWLQIIEKAKNAEKPVVFVTGDVKDDWWTSFQGKTVGPQPQLIQEFLNQTGHVFYMYTPDRFLERANIYLKQETSQQTLNEIRDIREEDADATILDQAINMHWPLHRKTEQSENKVDPAKLFTTYRGKETPTVIWSTDYSLLDLHSERQRLLAKASELQDHMDLAESQKVSLSKLMDRVQARPGEHSSSEIDDLLHEFRYSEQRVIRLEEELANIRDRIWELNRRTRQVNPGDE